ncbi:MAG: hypothetical protein ACLPYB_15505, partial [Desulfobaccales bacterium]
EKYYIEEAFINPLVLHSNDYYIKNQNIIQIDVSNDIRRGFLFGERAFIKGTKIDIAIPFEGDQTLWRIRPSIMRLSGFPDIEISGNDIVFSVNFPDDSANPDKLRSDIGGYINALIDCVGNIKREVDSYNDSSQIEIRKALEQKRILANSAIGAVAALGIPMKRRDTQPTFVIPAKRREQPARPPSVATGKYEPEPILDEKEYQHILEILRSMSLVIERNPSSFASLDEEAIRDHFLIQLNGHYEGSATGETFNASGKTDILIRVENKNVFIAECKFWHGPKAFNEAIDQLLGYLTWRDSKCALLIFNRTKDSSAVRQKINDVMQARPEHIKTVFHKPAGDSRYLLVKDSEPGREISVTTQLYDILAKNEK